MEEMRERNIAAILARGLFRYRKRAIQHVRKSPTPGDMKAGNNSDGERPSHNNGLTTNNPQGGES